MGIFTSDLWKVTTVDRMIKWLMIHNENQMNFRLPAASEAAGRRIETVVIINDLAGMHLGTVDSDCYSLIKQTA